ncbi:MAG: hypothetical protein A2937_01045 [Candidatus Yonathbacteria bacterium RIFCSPLOWO2_01_FULL_47_33b]|uniref:Uncharacterized protein n=1 Tax=Candidatus Yonathbacteria bacterium RIFCSPLOWO2_01_FULL_47_33b TaxID=1802727 RepID=A0A1G2SDU1_9BACT|nr:MAG: hypothetical protein A2937_01045 [Candidatus Yonathbacteria bacterium RIFCSPLOWO2_01_FULL_47_33b]
MKIEVNAVTTRLDKSPVIIDTDPPRVVIVNELPEWLCTKMVCLLKMLGYEGVTKIFFTMTGGNESILQVVKDGEHCTPEVVTNLGVRSYLEETVGLLAEHLKGMTH